MVLGNRGGEVVGSSRDFAVRKNSINVQELMKLGKGKKEIMADADDKPMHPFVAEKCMRQCRNFRRSELLAILEEGIQIEADIKTGQLNKVMGVELFLVSTAARGGKER